jgi:hypothetical protein
MTCLQTVATSYRYATLAEEEGQHVCHESIALENETGFKLLDYGNRHEIDLPKWPITSATDGPKGK